MNKSLKALLGIGTVAVIAANSLAGNLEEKIDTYTTKVDTAIGVGQSVKAAKLNALQEILEKYGLKVNSKTVVRNFALEDDEIIATTNGTVKKPRWKKYGRGKDGLYKVRLIGEVIPGSEEVEKMYRYAVNLINDGHTTGPIKLLNEIIEKYPDSERADDVTYLKIKCHLANDCPKLAEDVLRNLRSFYPDSPFIEKTKSELGPAFFKDGEDWYKRKRYNFALESFEKSVKYKPDNAIYLKMVGACHQNLFDFDIAIDYFNKSINLNPNDPGVYNGLGYSYYKVGKKEEAKEAWKKGMELGNKKAEKNYKWVLKK